MVVTARNVASNPSGESLGFGKCIFIQQNIDMIKKQMYESPATEVVVVTQDRFVCLSETRGRNSIKNWENGDTTEDVVYM